MTEQEKIEIFANYLPYGVKVAVDTIYVGFTTELVISNHTNSLKNGMNINQAIEYDAKLILHPLSNLTKPSKVDGYNDSMEFVPYCMIEDLGLAKSVSLSFASVVFSFNLYYGISISERLSCIKYDLEEEIDKINKLPHSIIKLLYKWHFDIHGLISQGLAIDINTLKNNTL